MTVHVVCKCTVSSVVFLPILGSTCSTLFMHVEFPLLTVYPTCRHSIVTPVSSEVAIHPHTSGSGEKEWYSVTVPVVWRCTISVLVILPTLGSTRSTFFTHVELHLFQRYPISCHAMFTPSSLSKVSHLLPCNVHPVQSVVTISPPACRSRDEEA